MCRMNSLPLLNPRVRQIIRQYALAAHIHKRVYPHLFRHQLMTFLTRKGIMSSKLQLLSGHAEEKNLALYRALALADVSAEYESGHATIPRAVSKSLIASHRSVPPLGPARASPRPPGGAQPGEP